MPSIKMGKLVDLPPGSSIEKRILARRIAVFNDGGTLYGIESDCKHMRASLAGGDVAEGVVTCRWHGWQYDLASGECLTNEGFKLKRYDVHVVDGDIVLDM